MSNKSGTAPQVVSLPSGGGALKGMGETFQPDHFTGTGHFTVPIEIPAGRAGFQPELALAYSSGWGNGPFGLGWALEVPQVSRSTRRGVPRYQDGDRFSLGGEELVPVGGDRFRPRTERAFAEIRRLDASAWQVRTLDGQTNVYGGPDGTLSDPADPTRIFCWNLIESRDPLGNTIRYHYRRDRSQGGRRWDQLYLEHVEYLDHDVGGSTRFLVSVDVVYDDAERPDPFSEYRAGFEIRTRLRAKAIEVHSRVEGDRLARRYELSYLTAQAQGVSLLTRVRCVGHDGGETQALPPLDFGYSPFEPASRRFEPINGTSLPGASLADPTLEMVSLFANGLPDLVQLDGSGRFWRNLGGGRFDRVREMPEVPIGASLDKPGVQMADLNGNGRADLMVLDQGGYFPLASGGRWSPRGFVTWAEAPDEDMFRDREVRLLDLDGDGVTDALRTGAAAFELLFNDPVLGWHRVERLPRGTRPAFPDVSFADDRIKLADLTGDGLQHIVSIDGPRVEYWPYLGHGRWAPRVTMPDLARFPAGQFDARRALFGDLDGDGVADLAYVEDHQVTIWINRAGESWSEPIVIADPPAFQDLDAIRIEDLLGSGMAGLFWTADDPQPASFLDLTGSRKPNLLVAVDNHRGARTQIRYAPSTKFYLADGATWQTPLPFPVQVVEAVETHDELSNVQTTTELRYHHGYWDGVDREFRGFGMVEQLGAEKLEKSWFHLGPIGDDFDGFAERAIDGEIWSRDPMRLKRPDDPLAGLSPERRREALRSLRGQLLRQECYGRDDLTLPFTVTEHLSSVRPVPGSDLVFFPHVLAVTTTAWERGDQPLTTAVFTDGHDDLGRPSSTTRIGLPRDAGKECLVSHELTRYAEPPAAGFVFDRICRVTSWNVTKQIGADLEAIHRAVLDGTAPRACVGQTLQFFDGEPFVGLPFGQTGERGVRTRAETLVLTDEIAAEAYGADLPPYLRGAAWPTEYPTEFRGLAPLAGYVRHDDAAHAKGWFSTVERQSIGPRGFLLAKLDPLGGRTDFTPDEFDLFPVEARGPTGLVERARHDYRVFQPAEAEDPNGHRTRVGFSPLGLVTSVTLLDRDGGGDTPAEPSTRFEYRFDRLPLRVRTVQRQHHAGEAVVPPAERKRTIETREYSDGFGRLLETRKQVDPVVFEGGLDGAAQGTSVADRVVVSGKRRYDDRGLVIEESEPFFSSGWDPEPAPPAAQVVRMAYDPLGRLVRVRLPDGTERRAVYGEPTSLDDPSRFRPSPWVVYTYDQNDLAGPAGHRGTPRSETIDAFGRVIEVVDRAPEQVVQRFELDGRGSVAKHIDPAKRPAVEMVRDLSDRPLLTASIDAGRMRTVFDAAGNEIEQRDGRGALVLRAYDALARITRLWARDRRGEPVTLREQVIHGEQSGSPAEARAANRLGRVHIQRDEAGVRTFHAYDFKGEPSRVGRRVIAETGIAEVVDWERPVPLDPDEHLVESRFDALGRLEGQRFPAAADGARNELTCRYDDGGGLTGVALQGETLVERIAYDAMGRRVLVARGNGVMTRRAYDPRSGQLVQLRSDRFRADGLRYQPLGDAIQDMTYGCDPVGNVTSLVDRSRDCGLPGSPDRLERTFEYDAVYRLTGTAGGREHAAARELPWVDRPMPRDVTRARSYSQRYRYDIAGNLEELRHLSDDGFTRTYRLEPGKNRVARLEVGTLGVDYAYDEVGNLIGEGSSRRYVWDHANRLREFHEQAGAGEPTRVVRYLYDADGVRVRKSIDKGAHHEGAIEIEGRFERHRQGTTVTDTLIVLDGMLPFAEIRVGPAPPGDTSPPEVFPLGDHQDNHQVSVEGHGEVFDREDQTPFGETSFGSYAGKGRRFTGRQRDRETGLSYHGARWYAPWLARWISPDPAGPIDGSNLYAYVGQNPINWVDPDGRQRVLIGRVYVIEGWYQGKWMTYVGSTAQELRARMSTHEWSFLLKDPTTIVTEQRVTGELNVPGETLRRMTNRALRSPEQARLEQVPKNQRLNRRNAATEVNAKSWGKIYKVRVGGRIVMKGMGLLSVIPDIKTVMELADAFQGIERVKLYGPTYVLWDDDGSEFVLYRDEGFLWDDFYKEYISGPQKGKRMEISKDAFRFFLREAELLWGKYENGAFVPGLFRTTPPPMQRADGSTSSA